MEPSVARIFPGVEATENRCHSVRGIIHAVLSREEERMKVLMINGSPRKESNTAIALAEMEKIFAE